MRFNFSLSWAALSVLAGCAEGPAAASDYHYDVQEIPTAILVQEQRLGSVDDADYGFTSIGGVDVDNAGLIYVLETREGAVRVYSAKGELVRRIGPRGNGPGELSGRTVYMGVDDTVWLYDWSPRRLTLFTR